MLQRQANPVQVALTDYGIITYGWGDIKSRTDSRHLTESLRQEVCMAGEEAEGWLKTPTRRERGRADQFIFTTTKISARQSLNVSQFLQEDVYEMLIFHLFVGTDYRKLLTSQSILSTRN